MNPNFPYSHPDANSSSLAHLHHLPPGNNPTPDPVPIPPQLRNRAQPQHAPLNPEQDGVDVDTGPDTQGTARESSPNQSPERGFKRARPGTDEADVLEHSEPVYKQRRTSSPEPSRAQPQAPAILSLEEIKAEFLQAVFNPNQLLLRGLKSYRPDTDEDEILEHSEPVYKQQRTSSPESTRAQPQAPVILSPKAIEAELLEAVGEGDLDRLLKFLKAVSEGDLDRLMSLRKQIGNVGKIFDENFEWIATHCTNVAVMMWFAKQGCNIQQENYNGCNALTLAAKGGHLKVVKWLTEQNCSVHQVNSDGDNALTLAVKGGHLEIVKWLATQNCSIDQLNSNDDNALTLAVKGGHLEVVKWLTTQNCSVDQLNSNDDNAVTLAAEQGHLEVVKWLSEQNCSIDQVNSDDDNAVTLAAKDGHLEVVKWLSGQNCSIDQVNSDGDNALTLAVKGGHLEVIKWLAMQNYSVDQVNSDGDNALTLAAIDGHLKLVRWLTAQNCSVDQVNSNGDNALTLAVQGGHFEVVKWLSMQNCSVNQVNSDGDNALTLAAKNGHLKLVKWLAEQRVDINHRNHAGDTPLTAAIAQGYTNTACELIKLGANVHISRSTHGDGLLFDALNLGNTTLISLLIPLFDVSRRSISGQTPLMVAAEKNLIEVAAPLIRASMASPFGTALLTEALPLSKKPLFTELLWNSYYYLTVNAIPSYSLLLPDTTPIIGSAVVSEHVFSEYDQLLSLQSSLGSGGAMTLMQMRSAKISILAELPTWILQHPLEDIFNDAPLSAESARLQNRVTTFINDDIEQLATIATGWEEEHLVPVLENLYETCLSHCLSEHPATDIVSTLSAQGLYHPIAQRIADAWMSAWATVPQAAPLLRPVAATHIDDWDNEDLANLDPNSGEVVIRPDTVARNIGKFVDTATGTELRQVFSAALRHKFDSVAGSILRINDTQLSEQSRHLYADLIGRQLHLIAQFWRATA